MVVFDVCVMQGLVDACATGVGQWRSFLAEKVSPAGADLSHWATSAIDRRSEHATNGAGGPGTHPRARTRPSGYFGPAQLPFR